MLKKTILNIHLYGGLLCFSYLLIFGISSLLFNHPFAFIRAQGPTRTWEQSISLADLPRPTTQMSGDEKVAAKAQANGQIRDALGLWGHQRPWGESYWKDEHTYHASLVRPGKQYEVDVALDQGKAQVTENRSNVWAVMRALHGLHGAMPNNRFVAAWSWYTELCTFFVLFAGLSGIYLWTRRRNERRVGLLLLGSAAAFSLFLMLFITFHG